MPQSVKIIADSVNPDGVRLTTFELSLHRYIWPELLTHRQLSRNAQSNRAIPTKKLIEMVRLDPALPLHWGKNQKGMQAFDEHDDAQKKIFETWWRSCAYGAADNAAHLAGLDLHKQEVNRLLEPYQWIRAIVSATDYSNFFRLRCDCAAQPEIRTVAEKMRDQMDASIPECIQWGEWHLPLIRFDDLFDEKLSQGDLVKISVARCARVSYLTHEGQRDPSKDIELHDQLLSDWHMSPFEHAAQANRDWASLRGNYDHGWLQYRKMVESGIEFSAS